MSNESKSSSTSTTSAKPSAKEPQQTAEDIIAKESAQGFRGIEVDPTDNEAYTVKGVTSGMPTPETDVAAAKEARGVTGLGLSALEYQTKENEAAAARRSKK